MSEPTLHYFAYGSNLYLPRMQARVPSARVLVRGHLDKHDLLFHKRGCDGSGKCNILHTGRHTDRVHGCIYTMSAAERPQLDAVEVPDYQAVPVDVTTAGGAIRAFTYLAPPETVDDSLVPFDWYLALVVVGARQHGLPEDYVARLATVAAVADPDPERNRINRYGSL